MKIILSYKTKGFFWFRIFGYGLCIKDVRLHRLLFSQRYGYSKYLKIGHYIITTLKRDKLWKEQYHLEKTHSDLS